VTVIRRLAVPPLDNLVPFLPRPLGSDRATREEVAAILDAVRERGDAAVREYTRELDRVDLAPAAWELPADGWQAALDAIPPALRAALSAAVDRIRSYHLNQRDQGFTLSESDGTVLGMKVTPLDRVGLYVPGGKASYPSSVIMNAVPAVVAGVQEPSPA
jgi:histidinol dehydrogenase